MNTSAKPSRTNLKIALVLVAIVALMIGAAIFQAGRDSTGEDASATPAGATDKFGLLMGEAAASVKVVVYEDFLCPACRQFEEVHSKAITDLTASGDISVEYRMMSFLDGASTTEYSTRSLNAFASIYETDGAETAEAFRELLFINQPPEGGPGLSDADLLAVAEKSGADVEALEEVLEERPFAQWIVNANDSASKDGVNGTPTVVVDGETLDDPWSEFTKAVEDALAAGGPVASQ